ncbi:MAG: hypothetical protein L0Z53_09220 [Acidobacteriales bacterium]|nr:hypothetical protein [Terriglobales bacterium]
MTTLSKRKSRLRFKTDAVIRGRNLVVEVEPYLLTIREARSRTAYQVSWESVYWLAVKKAVRQ